MKNNFNPQCITYGQMNLIYNLRIAWRRITILTRAYIISRYEGIGNAEEVFNRLYLEVQNFSDMIRLIFGLETSRRNEGYLVQYTIILRDLISANLEGNMEAIQQNIDRLHQNINDNAAFLSSINPYWSTAEWRDMLEKYFQYTIEGANSFEAADYKRAIQIFDRHTELTNRMGYIFAQGVYNYITAGQQIVGLPQGSQQCFSYEQMNQIYSIRMFWFELATWTISYMRSRYRGFGDVNDVLNRLRQVPIDYVNTLRQFFGENPAINELQLELNTYIDLIDDLITAQMEGNTDEIERITQLLYHNADERAASVSKLNPFWTEDEWRTRLYNNLENTLQLSTTYLNGDYARNLDISSMLLDQAESASDYFAQGLVNYLITQPK